MEMLLKNRYNEASSQNFARIQEENSCQMNKKLFI